VTKTAGVDIIVPVYGAAPDLERCLASVRAHTDLGENRLVIVLDGPQQPEVESALAALAGLGDDRAQVIRLPDRRGFAAAINRGIAVSGRDVILLNSDTQVTAGWVEKLRKAASSSPDVGTVTPFTSNGTICSLPHFLAENTVPAGHTVDSFAALVERVSERNYPRLPTGVGFCLYVRRRLFERVGPLDEARFPLGYGEETDLCRRASAAGFVHLLDDATYVWHRGRASFGPARASLVRRAETRMRQLHPDYPEAVAGFIRNDPIRPARERVLSALDPPRRPDRAPAPRRVLHLVQGWPPFDNGGSELSAQALALRQAQRQEVTAYARAQWPGRESGEVLEHYDRGVRVRLLVTGSNGGDRGALARWRLRRDFARFLRDERPELIHVHPLAEDCAPLLRVAARERVPIVCHIQNGSSPYPGARLLHLDGSLCSGSPDRCDACRGQRARGRQTADDGSPRPGGKRSESSPSSASAGSPDPDSSDADRYAEMIEAAYAEVLAGRRHGA
jgi:GT2 family glycosyltransferase